MLPMLIVPLLVGTPAPKPQETPRFDVFAEYVRELCETWENQAKTDREVVEDKASNDPTNASLMTAIRNSTRVDLALRVNISTLKKMRLTEPPHEQTLALFIGAYDQKRKLHGDFVEIVSTLLGGAKPGVDYGKLAATMPQITAMLDEVDHNLFRMSPLMFMVLIDMKGDSQNRANHLVITKEQRDSLVRKLEGYFGEALGKDKRYVASSALVMRDKLLEFKCSDDPWE